MSNFKLNSYDLNSNKNKFAHIFSNNEYENCSPRKGNSVDVKELRETLPKLGFKVKIHENLKRIKCLGELEKIADNDGRQTSVILVIFLSHGSLNEIKMTDGKTITIKQIAESFNSKGNYFAGKPKIFLFQMCQDDQSAKPLTVDEEKDTNQPFTDDIIGSYEATNNPMVEDEIMVEEVEDSAGSVPSGSDMFMGFSSSPGFVSYRSSIHGSRFIQTFTAISNDEINSLTRTDKIDFVSLMTKVAAEVAHMSGKTWPSRLGKNTGQKTNYRPHLEEVKMQMPWYSSTLTKKLEFEITSENQSAAEIQSEPQVQTPQQNKDDTQSDDN